MRTATFMVSAILSVFLVIATFVKKVCDKAYVIRRRGNSLSRLLRREELSDIPFETGDLLFFSGETFTENFIKLYLSSELSHVSMVVREGEEVYLWELDVGQGYKDGARVIPISKKLERYRGSKIFLYRKAKYPIPLHKVLKFIGKNMDIKFGDKSLSKFVLGIESKDKFCSELIAETLIYCGTLSPRTDSKRITPEYLSKLTDCLYEEKVFFDFSHINFFRS